MDHTSCAGHEELRDIALGTRNDVKHLQETIVQFMQFVNDHEARVRSLEIHGAKISQDNAEVLKSVVGRVDVLEGFKDGHAAAERETSKLAAIVAGGISTCGAVVSILLSLFWGRS